MNARAKALALDHNGIEIVELWTEGLGKRSGLGPVGVVRTVTIGEIPTLRIAVRSMVRATI